MTRLKRPWRDPAGRFSWLKTVVLAALFVPALLIAADFLQGNLGGRPVRAAEEELGLWTIRLIFLSLAVTPFARLLDWPRLVLIRRMVGVAAFAYAAAHLACYVIEQNFALATVVTEIVLRLYLTIGFVAVLGLTALAVTSTDAMTRRLGGARWKALHRTAYAIAALAVLHFFMQARLDATEPMLMAGLLLWLLGYRLLAALTRSAARPPMLLALALAAGVLTVIAETLYLAARTRAPIGRILDAQLSLAVGLRPGWIVLAIGLAVAVVALVRTAAARRMPA